MSHQDRKSQQQVVVNHRVLREVVNWLLPPTLFVGMRTRAGSKWKPRMLAAAALFWATSDRPTLAERFEHARQIIKKVFHWQSAPGKTYEGFVKMLRRRHRELLAAVVGVLRARMAEELQEQFQVWPASRSLPETAAGWRRRGQNRIKQRFLRDANRKRNRKRN